MSLEVTKICRTCLGLDGILLSIYDSNGSDGSGCVADMLRDLTNVKAKKSDGMPEKVCLACISEINRCYSFKMKCDNSDRTLRQLLDIPDEPQLVILNKYETVESCSSTELQKNSKVFDETNKPINRKSEATIQDQEFKEVSSSSTVEPSYILSVQHEEDDETTYFAVQSEHNETIDIVDKTQESSENSADYSIIFTKFVSETKDDEGQMIDEEGAPQREEPQPLTIKCSSLAKKSESKCDMCPMSFVHARNLDKHMAKVHKTNDTSITELPIHVSTKIYTVEEVFKEKDVGRNQEELDTFPEDSHNRDEEFELQTVEKIKEKNVKESISQNKETQVSELRCPRCKALFAMQSSLKIHIQMNKCSRPQFSCTDCKKVFISSDSLKEHIQTHRFTCDICSEKLNSKDDFDKHCNEHHCVNPKYQCPYCKKVFTMRSTLKDHMRIHTGEKPFVCDLCGKAFSQNANLKQHVMRHNKTKPHKCDQCHRSFVSKGELYAHLRSHSGDQPFRCDKCSSAFTTSSSLVKHKRIHTGERPYSCEFCPMRFTALNTLKNHRRTHTGEKPYKCKFCPRAFAQKSDCSIHTRTHTGERRYCCHICKSKFQQSGTLRTHMKTHRSRLLQENSAEGEQPSLELDIVEIEDDREEIQEQLEGRQELKRETDPTEVMEIDNEELLHFHIEECTSGNSVFSEE